MRTEASVLHLDLDAFFAAVEQRDKPSLRGKPVIVGGIGPRGVVATASYEARTYGVRSAMPTAEARRRCPHAAFLGGRFARYRAASEQVMGLLHELSPLVEPLSFDEAFVDLRASTSDIDYSPAGLTQLATELRTAVRVRTAGLTASVGVATSKLLAKTASELAKPDGIRVVRPGEEAEVLAPLPVSALPGVGPVTAEKLRRVGMRSVANLRDLSAEELRQLLGSAHAAELARLAHAEDDRPIVAERAAKSISTEDTFAVDVADRTQLREVLDDHSRQVAHRLRVAGLSARTVSVKVRRHDFTTLTRSRTLRGATESAELITHVARSLLADVDTTAGIRLLGVGVAGLTSVWQEDLFGPDDPEFESEGPENVGGSEKVGELQSAGGSEKAEGPEESQRLDEQVGPGASSLAGTTPGSWRHSRGWVPGADVHHDRYGTGWVWGAGAGRVTVRFETADTPPGPVRTLAADDPLLRAIEDA